MNDYFFGRYFESIYEGLKNSVYKINKEVIPPDKFFKEIKAMLISLRENKHKIFFFGNGASAAFANHMALDFSKNGKIFSRSLSDSALLTALSNDYTFEDAFVEFLKIEGVTKNDLVVTISSSGNSNNIVKVLDFCVLNQLKSLALSGLKRDNKSFSLANFSIFVPMKTYGMVECIHQVFLHLILDESMDILEWEKTEIQNMNAKNFKI